MSLLLDVSPQAETRFTEAARQRGVDPAKFFEKMVADYLSSVGDANEIGDFGGLSIAEAFPELIGAVHGAPTEMAQYPEKYMQGFGETKSQ